MNANIFQFAFATAVDLTDVEATLQVAIVAAEGIFGEAQVRMEVSYHLDPDHRAIHIDAGTAAGEAVVRVFTALVIREFGPDAFTVRRGNAALVQPVEMAA